MRTAIACGLMLLLVACRAGDGADETDANEPAVRLARELLLLDTHIDVPYRLTKKMEDVGATTDGGDFDYPRARQGGLDVAFFSIYVPASTQEAGGAKQLADELIDSVESIVAAHPDKFALGRSVAEVRRLVAEDKLVLALGMENGAPLEGELTNLRHFWRRGIRYITLAHSKSNRISDSSYDEQRRWHGLSPFGHEVVREMNRLGMMVDVSHITDEAFAQVIELSQAPVIASHSSCRHFTPGWERNMSDEMIRQLATHGGVIQINFGSAFLDDGYRRAWEAQRSQIRGYLEEHEIDQDSAEAETYAARYRREHPLRRATVGQVVDHIDHVVGLVGIDHVGFGSDFDGVGDSLPPGLEDVSKYPNLIAELLRRGYGEAQIEQIAAGNLLRVWSEVERVAARLGGQEAAESR